MLPLEREDPSSVGSYVLLGRLGSGGMGVVYLGSARDGSKVAVKLIRRELALEEQFRARFADEVGNAERVESFCAAQVVSHGEYKGRPYMVTEYISGPSLGDYVKTHGALAQSQLHSLAVGVATALAGIHAAKLVHRDLKPSNVLLSATGPRVIDFGIARALDVESHNTATGAVIGSAGWMAPEQVFEGRVSTAIDVFAWGSLVAFAAAGQHPYGRGTLVTLAARAQQGTPDLFAVPARLRPLVTAAMNADPDQRPTARELILELIGDLPSDDDEAASRIVIPPWREAPPDTGDLTLPPPATGQSEHPWRPRGLPRNLLPWVIGSSAVLVSGSVLLATADSSDPPSVLPASATPSPTATPVPGLIPKEFLGRWKGTVLQFDGNEKYPVQINLRQGEAGETVGTVKYRSLGCEGTLRLIQVRPDTLRLTEYITINGGCDTPVNLTLTFRAAKKLTYRFYDGDWDHQHTGEAPLTKS
ncbi:MAG: serine/threonine-protein kinase [Streptosporangiaceae bacterium]